MRKKRLIFVLILLLAIGFAAVSTTLLINANVLFGTNIDDFDVYFSEAILDEEDVSATVISTNGKIINYQTKALEVLNDESVLVYTVTNNSSHYDAKVSVNCELEDNEYVTVNNTLAEEIILAKTEEKGVLTVKLKKTSFKVDEITYNMTCTLDVEAIEREVLAEDSLEGDEPVTYSVYGEILDEEGKPVVGASVVMFSDPVYTITDDTGYFYLETAEKGSHSLYLLEDKSIEEIKELKEEEVLEISTSKVDITTSSKRASFENGFGIDGFKAHKTSELEVLFDFENDIDVIIKPYKKGQKYSEIEVPERKGYTFLSWMKEDGTVIDADMIISDDDHTITAKWEAKKYNISFDPNGVEEEIEGREVTFGTPYGELPKLTREGYIFEGWLDGDNNLITAESIINIDRDQTLVAKWENDVISVTFDPKGGTASGTAKMVVYSMTYGTLPTVEKEGYKFLGWYTSESGGTEVTASTKVTNAYAHTLYAQWSANIYTITLNQQSGSGGTQTIYLKYNTGWYSNSGATTSLSKITKPTRSGYSFGGYYTRAGGAGTQIIDASGNILSGKTTAFLSATTLYAKWAVVAENLNCATNTFPSGSIAHRMLLDNCAFPDNTSSTYVKSSSGISFGLNNSDTNGKGLYYTTDLSRTQDIDGNGTGERVYYFRGVVENNYLVFANICWRIVRTNENNSVKVIYAGDINADGSCKATGESVSIGSGVFNTKGDDFAYGGYMYPNTPTTSSVLNMNNDTINKNESNAKKIVDQWYDSKLLKYEEYISDAIYCADRTVAPGDKYYNHANSKLPYGKNRVFLNAIGRFSSAGSTAAWIPISNPKPLYLCPRKQDSFTVSSTLGNGKLTRPIGFITVDELSYAGARTYANDGSSYSLNNYLYSKNWFYTMSPSGYLYYGSTLAANIMSFSTHFGSNLVTTAMTFRPTISLGPKALITDGTGSVTDPYIIDTSNVDD